MTKGTQPKDKSLKEGFNKLGKKTMTRLVAARLRRAEELRIEREQKAARALVKEAAKEEAPKVVPEEVKVDELRDAYKMLHDLRYAYRNAEGTGGKKGKMRLLELLEGDAEFKFAVKELLKIEASLIAAKIRKDGDIAPGQQAQSVFVVLKGLDVATAQITVSDDKTVDLKQISRAINPTDDGSYEGEEESSTAPPEMLLKPVEGMV